MMFRFSCLKIDPFLLVNDGWQLYNMGAGDENDDFDVQKLGIPLPTLAQVLKQTHKDPVT